MDVLELSLRDLKLITPKIHRDERGFFLESYHQKKMRDLGLDLEFVQDNISSSSFHTIRGLHFQKEEGQDKLVYCLSGAIWDVAVDLRPNSPTFLKWQSVVLDGEKLQQLFVPKGFAHGFCVISPIALVQYKVSSFYRPELEESIRWNDPDLQIKWPTQSPILSERDAKSPFLQELQGALDRRK